MHNYLTINQERNEAKYKSRTIVYFIFFVLFIVFQGGFLGNIPVIFMICPVLVFKRLRTQIGSMGKALVFFGIYLTAVTLINFRSNFNQQNSINMIVEYLIAFICGYIAVKSIDFLRFCDYLKTFGVIIAIFGFVEFFTKYPLFTIILGKRDSINLANGYRILTVFQHPIICGFFLSIALLLFMIYPLNNFKKNIACILILITAMLMTQSRSSWVSTLLCVVIWSLHSSKFKIISKKTIKRIAYISGVLLIIVIILLIINKNAIMNAIYAVYIRIATSLEAGEGQGNIIRIDTVINSFHYWFNGNIEKMIFGMGKNYDKIFMQMFPVVKWGVAWTAAVDNQFITTIHEAGIIGLFPIIYIFYKSIMRLRRAKKNDTSTMVTSIIILNLLFNAFFYESFNYICNMLVLCIFASVSDKFDKKAIHI